jgi:hypothetical protein
MISTNEHRSTTIDYRQVTPLVMSPALVVLAPRAFVAPELASLLGRSRVATATPIAIP